MAELNYKELKKSISENTLSHVYFLQGEPYLVKYFENLLKKQILGNKHSDFDIVSFNSENLNLDKLSVALETFPIGAPKKCVVIKNLPLTSWNTEDINKFVDIISDIPEFSYLIISQYESLSSAKNFSKIKKFIIQNGVFSNFSKTDIPIEKQLVLWAKKEFGKILSNEDAAYIKKMCPEHSIGALKNELKKICEFEHSENITKESLEILVSSKLKTNIFSLPKAILEKNSEKAFKILEDLLGQKEEPIAILTIIANEYIDLHRVKCFLDSGRNPSELTKIYDYKGKEFRLKNAEKKCRHMSTDDIKASLSYILEADTKLKTTSLNPSLVLSELITKLILKNNN